MKVVITGGAGFLGVRLARALLARGELTGADGTTQPIDEVVLFDTRAAGLLGTDPRVRERVGDITDAAALATVIGAEALSVFHLASVVSAGAERDFATALEVNLRGGIALLEACRALDTVPRLVFASSVAVFGGDPIADGAGDLSKHSPRSTYGMTKAVLELLVNDYSRKGFLDGRSARLPTVIIRPGAPNRAASGFASAVFREPLAGKRCVLPVGPEARIVVAGYRAAVEAMVRVHELPAEALGAERGVNVPGRAFSVEQMCAALGAFAAGRRCGAIEFAPDPEVETIVGGWPQRWDHRRALALGLPGPESLAQIIAGYLEDFC